jgi:predicted CoA-binding protein
MSMSTTINEFLTCKKIAIAGVSGDPKKFGNILFCNLRDKGYDVYPINPNAHSVDGCFCYSSVQDLPAEINDLLIATSVNDTDKVVKEAIEKGIKNIWIQNGSETESAIKLAKESNVNLVSKACILMYADPKGFHKFHQVMAKWFGKYEN